MGRGETAAAFLTAGRVTASISELCGLEASSNPSVGRLVWMDCVAVIGMSIEISLQGLWGEHLMRVQEGDGTHKRRMNVEEKNYGLGNHRAARVNPIPQQMMSLDIVLAGGWGSHHHGG